MGERKDVAHDRPFCAEVVHIVRAVQALSRGSVSHLHALRPCEALVSPPGAPTHLCDGGLGGEQLLAAHLKVLDRLGGQHVTLLGGCMVRRAGGAALEAGQGSRERCPCSTLC